MQLADIGFLSPEEVQLIADGCQPVFVSELTALTQTMISRGLLYSIHGTCPHTQQSCFVLKTSYLGRVLIQAWMRHHDDASTDGLYDCPNHLELAQYLDDATRLVNHTAALGGCLHVSQSFIGSPPSSAIVTSLVACPDSLVLKVQEAIDRAVEEALCEFPVFTPTVH